MVLTTTNKLSKLKTEAIDIFCKFITFSGEAWKEERMKKPKK